jgi:Ca-activated chloride channel family protein
VSSRTTLLDALDALATQSQPGTVIGDGLSAAIDSILASRGDDSDRPAAIVLLTDGQDIGRTIAPTDAAARAKRLAIPVFTVAMVGSGLNAGPTEPAGTASSDLLQQIAETTGAKVFTAGSANELTQVYATLASQMSYELAIGNGAGPFVIVAVLLTFVSAALVLLGSRDPYSEPTSRSRLHRH